MKRKIEKERENEIGGQRMQNQKEKYWIPTKEMTLGKIHLSCKVKVLPLYVHCVKENKLRLRKMDHVSVSTLYRLSE